MIGVVSELTEVRRLGNRRLPAQRWWGGEGELR